VTISAADVIVVHAPDIPKALIELSETHLFSPNI